MGDKGILVYGYDAAALDTILHDIRTTVGTDVILINASGHEHDTVRDILEGCPERKHATLTTRFVMFLGFEDTEIRDVLTAFTVEPRPIFCCLTEQNYAWELSYLASHLEEEKEAMARAARSR